MFGCWILNQYRINSGTIDIRTSSQVKPTLCLCVSGDNAHWKQRPNSAEDQSPRPPIPPPHLARSNLHQGIQPPFRRVQVSWDVLAAHKLTEQASVLGKAEDVAEAEGRGAGLGLLSLTGVLQHGLRGADVWHHRLVHKRAEPFTCRRQFLFLEICRKFSDLHLFYFYYK